VDPFRRAFRGDANKSEVVSELFTDTLDRLCLEAGCGSLLSDHTRKRTDERESRRPRPGALRIGGQAQHGGLPHRDRGSRRPTRLHPDKGPPRARARPLLLELGGLADDEEQGPVVISYAGTLDTASDRVQDAIVAILSEGELEKSRGELLNRCEFSEPALSIGLSTLKRRGRVAARKAGRQVFYRLTGNDGNDGRMAAAGEDLWK
jgi:hypothetical protein